MSFSEQIKEELLNKQSNVNNKDNLNTYERFGEYLTYSNTKNKFSLNFSINWNLYVFLFPGRR